MIKRRQIAAEFAEGSRGDGYLDDSCFDFVDRVLTVHV
jgi:hypothetical protein